MDISAWISYVTLFAICFGFSRLLLHRYAPAAKGQMSSTTGEVSLSSAFGSGSRGAFVRPLGLVGYAAEWREWPQKQGKKKATKATVHG